MCDSFDYLSYSLKDDTEHTINEIRGHNRAYHSFGCLTRE